MREIKREREKRFERKDESKIERKREKDGMKLKKQEQKHTKH